MDTATRGVITTQVAGFPVALSLVLEIHRVPQLFPTSTIAPHVVVLVAAELPRDVAYWIRPGEAARIRSALEQAGFSLELRVGGLALQAGGQAPAHLRAAPDRVATLAPLVYALAPLGHHLRAAPPSARATARGRDGAPPAQPGGGGPGRAAVHRSSPRRGPSSRQRSARAPSARRVVPTSAPSRASSTSAGSGTPTGASRRARQAAPSEKT